MITTILHPRHYASEPIGNKASAGPNSLDSAIIADIVLRPKVAAPLTLKDL